MSTSADAPPRRYCILVHAGAGNHSPSRESEYIKAVKDALIIARDNLLAAPTRTRLFPYQPCGTALSACVAAVMSMELDECCNAGHGSNLNINGEVECDASVMEGDFHGFGACGAVEGIQCPVQLAANILAAQRDPLPDWAKPRVLGRVPPMLLVGKGALDWERAQVLGEVPGIMRIDPWSLITESAKRQWTKYVARLREEEEKAEKARDEELRAKRRRLEEAAPADESNSSLLHDTVGCVVCDGTHIASAVSSGGIWLKYSGRVGEAACFGAGCWAADGDGKERASVGASVSGVGEHVMARLLAREVGMALAPPDALSGEEAQKLLADDDDERGSGFVALRCDRKGAIEWVAAHSTPSFAFGVLTHNDEAPRNVQISRKQPPNRTRVQGASVRAPEVHDVADGATDVLTLKVMGLNPLYHIYVKMGRTDCMHKLMNAFCNRFGCAAQAHSQGIPFAALRFLANGNRFHDGVTPRELELVDGDTIDVLPNYPSGWGTP